MLIGGESRDIIYKVKQILYDVMSMSFSVDIENVTSTFAGINAFIVEAQKLLDQLQKNQTEMLIDKLKSKEPESKKENKKDDPLKEQKITINNVETIRELVEEFTNAKMPIAEFKQLMTKTYLEIVRDRYPTNVKIAEAIGSQAYYVPKMFKSAGVDLKRKTKNNVKKLKPKKEESKSKEEKKDDTKPLNQNELKESIKSYINEPSSNIRVYDKTDYSQM